MPKFRPMLASNCKAEDIKDPCMGSLKLEGVRGEFTPEGLLTRNLKDFNNELVYALPLTVATTNFCETHGIILEGEWYVHGWSFNRIDSCLRGNGNIDVNGLEFHVFDCYVIEQPDMEFKDRVKAYEWSVNSLQALGVTNIKAVQQTLMKDANEINTAYAWAVENGYEGFCLKLASGAYKHGRSTLKQELFVRLKPEELLDAVVIGIIERQENLCPSEVNALGLKRKAQNKDYKAPTGMAQSALVYTPQLKRVHKVSLTLGLTDVDRARIWDERVPLLGTCMSWIGIPVAGQEVHRSPRFKKWRNDLTPTYLLHEPSESLIISWDEAEIAECLSTGCDIITLEMLLTHLANKHRLGETQL